MLLVSKKIIITRVESVLDSPFPNLELFSIFETNASYRISFIQLIR